MRLSIEYCKQLREYGETIDRWTDLVNDKGLTLTNGNPIPKVFWKNFLGLSRSAHQEMLNGTYKRQRFSPTLAQAMRFADQLSEERFLEEVQRVIPEFEANKSK